MPVSWSFYAGRRIKKLEDWFRLNNIATYEEFLSHINVNDVIPPPESEIKEYLIGEPTLKQEAKSAPTESKPQQRDSKDGEDWSWARADGHLIEIDGD